MQIVGGYRGTGSGYYFLSVAVAVAGTTSEGTINANWKIKTHQKTFLTKQCILGILFFASMIYPSPTKHGETKCMREDTWLAIVPIQFLDTRPIQKSLIMCLPED